MLRVLEGNPGGHRLNRQEPKPRSVLPKPPPDLSAEALTVWRELAPRLYRTKLLTELDWLALGKLCTCEITYRRAMRVLDEKGFIVVTPSGYKQIRPEVSVVNRQVEMLRRYYAEFGMTPSARARISVKADEDDDDAEGILS